MADELFLDTNILLYTLDSKDRRYETAVRLVDAGGVISVQVLNEFVNSTWNKLRFPYAKSAEFLSTFKITLRVVPVTLETQEHALKIAMTNKIGIYDANIVAAAELAGCDVLYTEDMNHGQKFGRVSIVNPFMAM